MIPSLRFSVVPRSVAVPASSQAFSVFRARVALRRSSSRAACRAFIAFCVLTFFWLSTPAFAAPQSVVPAAAQPRSSSLRFEISFPQSVSAAPLDGRVFLLLSTNNAAEPRFQVRESGVNSQQDFGVDVDGLAPGHAAIIDASALGYPTPSLSQIPAGEYYVQGLLSRYTTFHRADGHTVKMPMDEGEGQHWESKPDNLYSAPERIHIDPVAGGVVRISLTNVIPPIEPPKDTQWVKHLRIQSELLTKFWGRPMYLGAIVLLPAGWDSHPEAHYPLLVNQGHFEYDYSPFAFDPPAPNLTGFAKTHAEYAYKFYQDWTSGRLPHMLILVIQHANPYYDDSYAVNSANVGPYGDAITQELIPYVEKQFRGIGQGWARATYGGSTGGWEALASQVFYPEFYNGTFAFCPDPVDFRKYQLVNIYEDKLALWTEGVWTKLPRGEMRETDETILTTMENEQRHTNVSGTLGRSGEQMDIWQAVWGPVGPDGYVKPIWDQYTGVIDHQVAEYWRDHYDLRYILDRDWKILGPKLVGKIHVFVGTRDTYYLDLAVKLLQQSLETTNNPYYAGSFDYGPDQPHCYTGEPELPARLGSLTATQRVMQQSAAWMLKTAPAGADVTSWRY